jgi:hypothetical protein
MRTSTRHTCSVTFLARWSCAAVFSAALALGNVARAKECLDVNAGIALALGELAPDGIEKSYCIYAHAGQTMQVTIKPLTPDLVTKGIIIYPQSHQADGGPGGVIFNGKLPEDGRYEIRVGQRFEPRSGEFEMMIELK